MSRLTPQGQQMVDAIAARYGLSTAAVSQMLEAVAAGGGSMAQFNIAELGGGGQWMQGGMTMVGDMFNHGLKMTVDNLCGELASLYLSQPFAPPPKAAPGAGVSLFMPGGNQAQWWPSALGQPASSGSQNNMRYAYFPQINRLAVDAGGVVVYDTLNHQIGGFSQQQSVDGSITLTSQFGVVALNQLPRVALDNPLAPPEPLVAAAPIEAAPQPEQRPAMESPPQPPQQAFMQEPMAQQPVLHGAISGVGTTGEAIFATIEKLAGLKEKGWISEQEFNAKKTELLARL
ncbi:conserved hypothetical protein [Magnetococcus marinus MC-1]|uniref:SHOCT domain-containing protein n=1 Tax=Magnetococcus marinus (strain ATCC BAA-1437 / JCM 17883 / MC-1) TaxID=156889 RepID=A0LCV0_MAGMM|nr:SHOCT domain-containing protein [Magnetococcus marinus]ABK45793.1 conserved hypothetical protein [Magnetococcus marinus MC-1]